MTIDSLTTPLGPLAKVELFGHPFHGPVSASQLTLPNSTTRAYLQPTSADAWALTLAGVPAVTRTELEAAADAAAGHQWLQKLVISGAVEAQVYGKRLSGEVPAWIWRDANGVCWQFGFPTLATYQTSIRIRARKFGRIGEPIYTATDTDLAHAVDDGAFAVSLATAAEGFTTTVLRICDINADGSKVILGIFARAPRTWYAVRFGPDYVLPAPVDSALGFLLIEVTTASPTPALSLTTLRNHRATLGTVSGTRSRVPAGDWADLPPHPTDSSFRIGAVTYTSSISITGRIASMYFGPADAPKEFTLGYSLSAELVRDFDMYTIPVPGHGDRFFPRKETQTTLAVSFSLSRDGTQVASVTVPHQTYASVVSINSSGVYTYFQGGTYTVWFGGDYYTIGPYTDPSEAELLGESRQRTQTGLWLYSKKLAGLFSVSNSGLVTWTACFSPDGTAAAQAPATGTWTSDGGFGSNLLFGGPNTWWRAIDPLTGAISTTYSTPVCYV